MATTTDTPVPGPVRTCVGCRAKAAASELLRVVAGSDAEGRPALVPDPAHRAPGRGAHLHPTSECWELAVRRRAFPRALRSGVTLADTPLVDYLATLEHELRRAGLALDDLAHSS